MAAALLTGAILAVAGLASTSWLGLRAASEADLWRHTSFGIFSTMLTLLAHSMMMFYLIGKGRAVKDAMKEAGLSGDFLVRIARLRKPVLLAAVIGMLLTMVTAISGASVDTHLLPPPVHGVLGFASFAANVWTLRLEIVALTASAKIVSEVDHLLGS